MTIWLVIAIFFLPLLFLGLGANDIMGDVFSSPDIIIASVVHVPYYYFLICCLFSSCSKPPMCCPFLPHSMSFNPSKALLTSSELPIPRNAHINVIGAFARSRKQLYDVTLFTSPQPPLRWFIKGGRVRAHSLLVRIALVRWRPFSDGSNFLADGFLGADNLDG